MEISFGKFDHTRDLQKQRRLFEECFPETVGTQVIADEHYFWKFHSKPGSMASSEFIASSSDDMLGYYAAIPFNYKFNNRLIKAAMVCDVMTSPKARGKGIFTKLGSYSTDELAKRGFDLTTGYPIRPEVIPGHLKVGWEKFFDLPLFGRIVSVRSFLNKKKIGFLAPVFDWFLSLIAASFDLFLAKKNINLIARTFRSADLEKIQGLSEFYLKWQATTVIGLVKDLEFLKWRLEAPSRSYYIVALYEEDQIVGVLIATSLVRDGIPCMGILELAMLKDFESYSSLLITPLVGLCKQMKLDLILIMISRFWSRRYKFFNSFFFKTPFKFQFIVKLLNSNLPESEIKNEANWHVMWIDSDDL